VLACLLRFWLFVSKCVASSPYWLHFNRYCIDIRYHSHRLSGGVYEGSSVGFENTQVDALALALTPRSNCFDFMFWLFYWHPSCLTCCKGRGRSRQGRLDFLFCISRSSVPTKAGLTVPEICDIRYGWSKPMSNRRAYPPSFGGRSMTLRFALILSKPERVRAGKQDAELMIAGFISSFMPPCRLARRARRSVLGPCCSACVDRSGYRVIAYSRQ
jgi:hypothetical protein